MKMYHLKLEWGQMVVCIMSSINKTFFFSNVLDETKFGSFYKIGLPGVLVTFHLPTTTTVIVLISPGCLTELAI